MEFVSHSPDDTARFAREIAERLTAGDILLYRGDMGAGKTTFTKALAAALGVRDVVTSPTFAIVNEYNGKFPLFHFDLYRIDNFDDLYAMGFFDYLGRNGIIAAEWSENIPGFEQELSRDGRVITVIFEITGEFDRKITLSGL